MSDSSGATTVEEAQGPPVTSETSAAVDEAGTGVAEKTDADAANTDAADATSTDADATIVVDPPSAADTAAATGSGKASDDIAVSAPLKTRASGAVGDSGMDVSEDVRQLWLPPLRSVDMNPTNFVNGGKRTVGFWYDPAHANHHPYAVTDVDIPETPRVICSAYAHMVYARAFTDLVTHHAAPPVPSQAVVTAMEGKNRLWTSLRDPALAQAYSLQGVAPQKEDQLPRFIYGNAASKTVTQNIAAMVEEATISVVRGDVDGAMVLSRPVGAAVSEGSCGYAHHNAVLDAVRAARAEGIQRLAVVSLQPHQAAGTMQALWGDEDALVISVHHDGGKDVFPFQAGGSVRDVAPNGAGLNIGLPFLNISGTDILEALRRAIVPALMAFDPDFIVFVVGDSTTATTTIDRVKLALNARIWSDVLQAMLAIQPRVLVLTDILLRPQNNAEALSNVLHVLQGRGFASPTLLEGSKACRTAFKTLEGAWTSTVPKEHRMHGAMKGCTAAYKLPGRDGGDDDRRGAVNMHTLLKARKAAAQARIDGEKAEGAALKRLEWQIAAEEAQRLREDIKKSKAAAAAAAATAVPDIDEAGGAAEYKEGVEPSSEDTKDTSSTK